MGTNGNNNNFRVVNADNTTTNSFERPYGLVEPTIASIVLAKTAWDALHTTYANRSQTRVFSLRDQLARITKDSRSITEYLQTIRSLSDELATAGAPVSNPKLIVKILSGLGPEFREISAAIRARDTNVTYEELFEKLLDHELFLRHEDAKKLSTPITPHTNTNYRNNRSAIISEWAPNSRSNTQPRRLDKHEPKYCCSLPTM
ncbi:uncharacterized protein LOC132061567 [Lycium ferocissimum]|uniref:uncharacterized protein LOC132061567 n=1 Tax=Lycium ferocissimum TaxID=112874 RepID=UPI002815D551|nr:uncharacterized protein LOC132061567 [Lycium ferocissimum]